MKRNLIVALLLILAFSSVSEAQRRTSRTRRTHRTRTTSAGTGKIAVTCPSTLNSIQDCPDTGCGGSLDPNLNKQKNIRTDNDAPVDKDFQDLSGLPDPVPGFAIG